MNVADIIAQHAAATPRAVAIAGPDGGIDYALLDRAVWRASAWLRARGMAPGDVVGLALGTHALHLVVSYALARIGAVQLGLSKREPEEQRRRLAARLGARITLNDDDLQADWLRDGGENYDISLRAAGGDAGWKVVLSSGTTGEPKAAVRTHAMALAGCRIQQAATALTPADRCLSFASLDFFIGLTRCVDVHFAGAAVVLPPASGRIELLALIARESISYLSVVPARIDAMLGGASARGGPGAPGLRLLRLDAMALNEPLRKEICARITPRLFHSYGTNEAGLLAFALGDTLEKFPGAAGYVAPGVTLEIVDEAGAAVPPGSVGRVRVKTPALIRCYIDDPDANASAFSGGWHYPGDLGTLSDGGLLYIKGRADQMMNFGGVKIYPAEIEAALLQHPAVVEAAAFPLVSPRHQHVPAVAVVAQADPDELLAWSRQRLGAHAPCHVMVMSALPKNAMGKVLKGDLGKILLRQIQRTG